MAFDLGEMIEQMKNSMMGGSKSSSSAGGGANGKRGPPVVYDAAIVGYGPAGGVMVSGICSSLLCSNCATAQQQR